MRSPESAALRGPTQWYSEHNQKSCYHLEGNLVKKLRLILPSVFAVLRFSPEGGGYLLSLINVSNATVKLQVPLEELAQGGFRVDTARFFDIVGGMEHLAHEGTLYQTLSPYDVVWLEGFRDKG